VIAGINDADVAVCNFALSVAAWWRNLKCIYNQCWWNVYLEWQKELWLVCLAFVVCADW